MTSLEMYIQQAHGLLGDAVLCHNTAQPCKSLAKREQKHEQRHEE